MAALAHCVVYEYFMSTEHVYEQYIMAFRYTAKNTSIINQLLC